MIDDKKEISYNILVHAKMIFFAAEDSMEGGIVVSEVRVGKNESLDSALRRFKRTCQKSGVMAEIRKHEHYEKPSVKRKKKAEAARKRK